MPNVNLEKNVQISSQNASNFAFQAGPANGHSFSGFCENKVQTIFTKNGGIRKWALSKASWVFQIPTTHSQAKPLQWYSTEQAEWDATASVNV